MTGMKLADIVPIKESDLEPGGATLSARDTACRMIDTYDSKSLQTDVNGNARYSPFQKAFYREKLQ